MTTCEFTGLCECPTCVKMQESYKTRFEREYRDAKEEVTRLSELFKDVCWYNFETTCRKWRHPWRQSKSDSLIELHAHRYEKYWNRRHLCEAAKFPYYYQGTLEDAPPIPPEIVLNELREAELYLKACTEQIFAPYDWAPGGAKYEALRRTTLVGTGGQRRNKRKLSSGLTYECDGDSSYTPFAP